MYAKKKVKFNYYTHERERETDRKKEKEKERKREREIESIATWCNSLLQTRYYSFHQILKRMVKLYSGSPGHTMEAALCLWLRSTILGTPDTKLAAKKTKQEMWEATILYKTSQAVPVCFVLGIFKGLSV